MNKFIALGFTAISLSGCADATRTVPVLVWEDRPIGEIVYREHAPLVVPSDYHNPNLRPPREDTVLLEYKKNNFIGTAPLPPPRPYNLTQPKNMQHHCNVSNTSGCVK